MPLGAGHRGCAESRKPSAIVNLEVRYMLMIGGKRPVAQGFSSIQFISAVVAVAYRPGVAVPMLVGVSGWW